MRVVFGRVPEEADEFIRRYAEVEVFGEFLADKVARGVAEVMKGMFGK